MQADDRRSTSATLLGRLRNEADDAAWTRFYEQYAPRIRSWCQQRRLGPEDTDDLTQNVLVRVVRLFRNNWIYDPGQNFSGLLRTLWHRAFSDWWTARTRRVDVATGGEGTENLETLEAKDLVNWLKDFLVREELEEALARLEIDHPDDVPLLRARLSGESAAQIAARTGQQVAAVGMAVSRAMKRLNDLLRALGSDLVL